MRGEDRDGGGAVGAVVREWVDRLRVCVGECEAVECV